MTVVNLTESGRRERERAEERTTNVTGSRTSIPISFFNDGRVISRKKRLSTNISVRVLYVASLLIISFGTLVKWTIFLDFRVDNSVEQPRHVWTRWISMPDGTSSLSRAVSNVSWYDFRKWKQFSQVVDSNTKCRHTWESYTNGDPDSLTARVHVHLHGRMNLGTSKAVVVNLLRSGNTFDYVKNLQNTKINDPKYKQKHAA